MSYYHNKKCVNQQSKPVVCNSLRNSLKLCSIGHYETDTQNNEDQKFQDMLKRNLDITQKEKEKRGFSLNNKNK